MIVLHKMSNLCVVIVVNIRIKCRPVQRSLMGSIRKVDDVFYRAVGGQHHLDHLERSLSAGQVKRRGLVVLRSKNGQVANSETA